MNIDVKFDQIPLRIWLEQSITLNDQFADLILATVPVVRTPDFTDILASQASPHSSATTTGEDWLSQLSENPNLAKQVGEWQRGNDMVQSRDLRSADLIPHYNGKSLATWVDQFSTDRALMNPRLPEQVIALTGWEVRSQFDLLKSWFETGSPDQLCAAVILTANLGTLGYPFVDAIVDCLQVPHVALEAVAALPRITSSTDIATTKHLVETFLQYAEVLDSVIDEETETFVEQVLRDIIQALKHYSSPKPFLGDMRRVLPELPEFLREEFASLVAVCDPLADDGFPVLFSLLVPEAPNMAVPLQLTEWIAVACAKHRFPTEQREQFVRDPRLRKSLYEILVLSGEDDPLFIQMLVDDIAAGAEYGEWQLRFLSQCGPDYLEAAIPIFKNCFRYCNSEILLPAIVELGEYARIFDRDLMLIAERLGNRSERATSWTCYQLVGRDVFYDRPLHVDISIAMSAIGAMDEHAAGLLRLAGAYPSWVYTVIEELLVPDRGANSN